MESDLQHYPHHLLDYHQRQHNQKHINSGLTRYQSAPSSYFSNILDRDFCRDILNQPSSPETKRIIDKFLSIGDDAAVGGGDGDAITEEIQEQNLCTITPTSPVRETTVKIEPQTQVMTPMDNQTDLMQQQQQANYSSVPQNLYQSQPQPYSVNQQPGSAMGSGKSNLVRHSSTPAGWFSKMNMEIIVGYGAMRDNGSVNSSNREAAFHSASRPPAPPPPSGLMPPIAEMGNNNISSENAGFGENHPSNYSSGFPSTSWDNSMNMSGMKRLREDDRSLSGLDLDGAETKNADGGNHCPPPPLLAHHLSLPRSSPDMSAIEKLLQYQDSVPFKTPAKRGFATHPRSIAERVRRTKISERMKKLQDLVPNMDKQTNTADMLDLAVDYIKDLQEQAKILSDSRANCSCTSSSSNDNNNNS